MQLAAMRFRDFIWPHNPRTYMIDYERVMATQKLPFGTYRLQDLGRTRRVMRGEGEFVGVGAYDQFKALASVFYQPGAGALVHPVWQATQAYFVDLQLRQAPRADYVAYSFTFWEAEPESGTVVIRGGTETGGGTVTPATVTVAPVIHKVVKGDSLWVVARRYGTTVEAIMALNPDLRNPNLILVGQEVRVA